MKESWYHMCFSTNRITLSSRLWGWLYSTVERTERETVVDISKHINQYHTAFYVGMHKTSICASRWSRFEISCVRMLSNNVRHIQSFKAVLFFSHSLKRLLYMWMVLILHNCNVHQNFDCALRMYASWNSIWLKHCIFSNAYNYNSLFRLWNQRTASIDFICWTLLDSIQTHWTSKRDHRDAYKCAYAYPLKKRCDIDWCYNIPSTVSRSVLSTVEYSHPQRQEDKWSDSWKNTCDFKIISYRNDPGQVFPWIYKTTNKQMNIVTHTNMYYDKLCTITSFLFVPLLH